MSPKLLALLGSALLSGTALAEGAATVSFLTGSARRTHAGQTSALAMGGSVAAGDEVATGTASRLELTLADRSVVRLGPSSKLTLREAELSSDGAKKFSAKLLLGKLWAKVASTLGGESHFDVETDNAVAGVRGTTFRVDAHHDRSVLVRVYAGAVAVAAANRLPMMAHASTRQEVAGPTEVDKHTYEKLVARMMQVHVSAAGELGEPESFTAESEAKDRWVAWNEQRDDGAGGR
ncbi:MAG TPA: FecR family protein [Myxococcales bacterium]|nr:FecR family protein [Myxococcales bacterium]